MATMPGEGDGKKPSTASVAASAAFMLAMSAS